MHIVKIVIDLALIYLTISNPLLTTSSRNTLALLLPAECSFLKKNSSSDRTVSNVTLPVTSKTNLLFPLIKISEQIPPIPTMKFGKSLSSQIEEALPEWRDKFLSYKLLKKRLKLFDTTNKRRRTTPVIEFDGLDQSTSFVTPDEQEFMDLLQSELDKFNAFFVEKEEEYIIHQKELQDQVRAAKHSKQQLMRIRKEIVDFHGEMVLLENYSALNYTGLVKILKKYDKRTGALMRLPFIQKVLQQPFFTTDLLYKLVNECEAMLDHLFPNYGLSTLGENDLGNDDQKPSKQDGTQVRAEIPGLEEMEYMESLYMKSTVAALRSLKEIRSRSSTVSVFSLPPLSSSGHDESWSNVAVLEQEAK